jgi:hypothetical protein
VYYASEEEIVKTWRFEVLGEDQRGDREVVRLKVLDVSGEKSPHCYILEVVKDSFTLSRLIETGAPDQEAKRRLTLNPYGDESWFHFETGGDCILDFPKLPSDCEDETREIQAASAPSFTQYTSFYGDNNYMQIQMYGELAGDRLRCTQYWERGLPWWKEAKRDLVGKELIRGELILETSEE